MRKFCCWANVDRCYLVAFCCLLPFTTWFRKVEISICPQMYLKKPETIPGSFEATLELLFMIKSSDNEP